MNPKKRIHISVVKYYKNRISDPIIWKNNLIGKPILEKIL